MSEIELTDAERQQIDELVELYNSKRDKCSIFLNQMSGLFTESQSLAEFVHSIKWRLKKPDSLRDKLVRKMDSAKGNSLSFDVTRDNFFDKINDLAGLRILHLHTRQMESIHPIILELLEEVRFTLVKPPTANTWDNEYTKFFKDLNIETHDSESMYTSVHYVIASNSKTRLTGEIQVRTLAEELWGEVDHTINYPKKSGILACEEQIKVLARVTSSCTRLVDSIFKTYEDARSK